MFKFFIYFIIIQVLLFATELSNAAQERLIIPFTEAIAWISSSLIQVFDDRVSSEGIVIRNLDNGFAVAIQAGCNGVEALIVLVAAIIAFPSPWKHKLIGIIAGFFAVEILNLVRIISLFYLGQWNFKIFEWAHLYIWEALIMLDVLILFLIWLRYLPRPATQEQQHAH